MYLSQISKLFFPKLKIYFCKIAQCILSKSNKKSQITKCIFLKLVNVFVSNWQSMAANSSQWQPMAVDGSQWQSLAVNGSQLQSM